MWDPYYNPDGDHDWTWDFVYDNQTEIFGYDETDLKNILAEIVACDTEDGFGCKISDDDLLAAKEYTQESY